jgi:type I restriction enzyme, R subunit
VIGLRKAADVRHMNEDLASNAARRKPPRVDPPTIDEQRGGGMKFNEDTLVQKTAADYLHDNLGWESVYAYNDEDFGPNSLLGRKSDREVVLARDLRVALVKLNPGFPDPAYEEAIRQITEVSASQSILATNRDKYDLLRDGVLVSYRDATNKLVKARLRIFDFDHPKDNRFLCVRELWIRGDIYRRRADIVGFVNGIPLIFMECKNIHKDLRRAYDDNLSDYRDTIPHILHHNAVIILGNGDKAKMGSITSLFEHFQEWKRLSENEPGVVDMETLLKGVCCKENFLDLFENFILFDDSTGKTAKIVAKNHQYLGVNNAIESLRKREAQGGKLGVFWHTQGSGKSYSMVSQQMPDEFIPDERFHHSRFAFCIAARDRFGFRGMLHPAAPNFQ